MSRVLVLNGHERYGVVVVRGLGTEGINVTVGSSKRWNASRFSTYTDRFFSYPNPEHDLEGFLCTIEEELKTGEYDMLLPINEETVEIIVNHRSRFEKYTTVPFPEYDRLQIGLNKRQTVKAARQFNIPHPKTVCSDEGDLDVVEERLGYPIVVKSERGSGHNGVAVCDSREELEQARRTIQNDYGAVLYQEFIPNGGERGVYTLYGSSGELTALTVQQRLRTNPPSGGGSTYRETVADPDLVSIADDLLTALDWRGLAMAEFRIDARTGDPQLLEINPRLWGSLALSIYAGVNFPYLLYQMAVGDDPNSSLRYTAGVQARCLFTDFLQVLNREDKLTALREFLTPAANPCCYDILSKQDPYPILGQILYWAAEAGDKVAATFDPDAI